MDLETDQRVASNAVRAALDLLQRRRHHEETRAAPSRALALARSGAPTPQNVESLGGGWVAEEALAIGLYTALMFNDDEQGYRPLTLAVNHSGDSDSTGSICGNLIGAQHGSWALPLDWTAEVEGQQTIWNLSVTFTHQLSDHP